MTRGHARRTRSSGSLDNSPPAAPTVNPFAPPPVVSLSHQLLDLLMPICDPYEWKIICAVLRHEDEPRQSIATVMDWTGIHNRRTCFDAMTRCLRKGYLVRLPAGNSFTYHPNPNLALSPLGLDETHQQTSTRIRAQ
jgi:hypothetical protein